MSADIVAQHGSDRIRHATETPQNFLRRQFLQRGLASEGVVGVGNVRLVVLRMVNFHRPRIEVRFERTISVPEFGQRKRLRRRTGLDRLPGRRLTGNGAKPQDCGPGTQGLQDISTGKGIGNVHGKQPGERRVSKQAVAQPEPLSSRMRGSSQSRTQSLTSVPTTPSRLRTISIDAAR